MKTEPERSPDGSRMTWVEAARLRGEYVPEPEVERSPDGSRMTPMEIAMRRGEYVPTPHGREQFGDDSSSLANV